MNPGDLVQNRFLTALRTQKKADPAAKTIFSCPYPGHEDQTFHGFESLYSHAKAEHASQLIGLEPREARAHLKERALKISLDQSSDATAGDRSTPDITGLTLDSEKGSRQPSPPSSRKRPAESEHRGRPGKVQSYIEQHHGHLYDPQKDHKGSNRTTPDASSDWSNEPAKRNHPQRSQPQSPAQQLMQRAIGKDQTAHRQPGLIELQKHDSRYSLLLQPDSRPISQEQLASEVKSIYAGLTMVETKCIHVDRAQAAQETSNTMLASDHWQALIALHRTLLHEHHDFFLASQHPSASPALRRLAAKYSMPARMWKHGIHSFLELLRRRLPESIDYMLAFIYLAYQMMALLYETVPTFEETWIECLGDLGRYRMAIEDEDLRDRETWAGVARSWYTKAADKNPTVGRLYHHLAILARPNALQQLYYYSRSLTCVKPFASARESILTLLEPILGKAVATYSHALPVDASFIKAHALLFEQRSGDDFKQAMQDFLNHIDNHIGRVTATWKEQGVYVAVTNVAGWFDYGVDDNVLRQVFLNRLFQIAKDSPPTVEETVRSAAPGDQHDPVPPSTAEVDLPSRIDMLSEHPTFVNAKLITNDTFTLVLRRIGDKNVLPHVHVMLAFLDAFSANTYVSRLLVDTPWAELISFLNTLIKTQNHYQIQTPTPDQTQNIDDLLSADVFPNAGERTDELPLPEDYLIRGLIWAQEYFPKTWFLREHDEEERYLEHASTVKTRTERVLRLAYQLAQKSRWVTYDMKSHTFKIRS
ncbi:hypothetical protein ACN47E_001242 [Coniothyrium glycines]